MPDNRIRLSQLYKPDVSDYVQEIISASSLIGPSGVTGPSGPTGPEITGADGPSGETGPSGASVVGPQGTQGPSGLTGPSGAIGLSGASITGPSGGTGPVGAQGPQGPQGTAGSTNAHGSDKAFQIKSGNHGMAGTPNLLYNYSTTPHEVHADGANIKIGGTGIIESVGGNDAYLYIEPSSDDLVIRKSNQGIQLVIDGDAGNVGIKLPTGIQPSYPLDVSGEALFRGVGSEKIILDHDTNGSEVLVYDSVGSSKVKLSSYSDSWIINDLALGTYSASQQLDCAGKGQFEHVIVTGAVPASNNSPGIAGQIAVGGGYLYACTSTNVWGRVALTSF